MVMACFYNESMSDKRWEVSNDDVIFISVTVGLESTQRKESTTSASSARSIVGADSRKEMQELRDENAKLCQQVIAYKDKTKHSTNLNMFGYQCIY